jgi:hypothetical protein
MAKLNGRRTFRAQSGWNVKFEHQRREGRPAEGIACVGVRSSASSVTADTSSAVQAAGRPEHRPMTAPGAAGQATANPFPCPMISRRVVTTN